MGDEGRHDAPERRRADVYSSARIGAAAALTLVLVVLLVLDVAVPAYDVSPAILLPGVRPSTAKRHLADLRERSGLSTEQLIYAGRAGGWLLAPSLEPVRTPAG